MDKREFYESCWIKEFQVIESWYTFEHLKKIHDDYAKKVDEYENLWTYTVQNFLRYPDTFHSIKYRVKSPESLVEKIVKKWEDKRTKRIDIDNYENVIDDLVWIRVLLLDRNGRGTIHEFIRSKWSKKEYIAYIREWDNLSDYSWKFLKSEISNKRKWYTSFHYIVYSKPSKKRYNIEIQVRSLLEEVWWETDHLVRYKKEHKKNKELMIGLWLDGLNQIVVSWWKLVSFLCKFWLQWDNPYRKEIQTLIDMINDLPLDEKTKKQLTDEMYHFLYPATYLTKDITLQAAKVMSDHKEQLENSWFLEAIKNISDHQKHIQKQLESAKIPSQMLADSIKEIQNMYNNKGVSLPTSIPFSLAPNMKEVLGIETIEPVINQMRQVVHSHQDSIFLIQEAAREFSEQIKSFEDLSATDAQKQIALTTETIKNVGEWCETLINQNQVITDFADKIWPKILRLVEEGKKQ